MSAGCLSCFKCIWSRKKQSKKQPKLVTETELPELVKGNDEEEESVKKLPERKQFEEKDKEQLVLAYAPTCCSHDAGSMSSSGDGAPPIGSYDGGNISSGVYGAPPPFGSFYGGNISSGVYGAPHYASYDEGSILSGGKPPGESWSPTRNDFNKVKLFDIRGGTQNTGK